MKHIIARRLFSDLHHNLTREHFNLAGHEPLFIEFSEKAKAVEPIPAVRTFLSMLFGFKLCRGKRHPVMVSERTQTINTVKISSVHLENSSNFDGLFKAIEEQSPRHFNKETPIPIKYLTTRHLESGCICNWEKVKINVGGVEELRLMLKAVDNEEATLEDGAEDYADGMMETVCETVEATITTRNVCELVAKRMGY